MGVTDIFKWPEGILKVLHAVFSLLAVIFFLSALQGVSLKDAPKHQLWLAMICILLICGVGVIIWLICSDPRECKFWLLVYYIVGAILAFIGLSAGFAIIVALLDYSGITKSDFFWLIVGSLVSTIAVFVVYVVSAVLNVCKGRP